MKKDVFEWYNFFQTAGRRQETNIVQRVNFACLSILYLCFAQIALCMKHFIQMQELKNYYYSW